jgi:hypothetical protein
MMRLFYIRRAKEISKLCHAALNADKRGQGANFSEAMNKMSAHEAKCVTG